MKPLGIVFNFSPNGAIVVKAGITPGIGNIICDKRGRSIGKVVRITGPVSEPYVLITPNAKDEMSMFRLSGKQVFIDDSYQPRPQRNRRPPSSGQRQDRRPPRPRERDRQFKKNDRIGGKRPANGKRKIRR